MIALRWLRPRPGDEPVLMGLLDETERSKAHRLRHPQDRLAFVAAHALLRSLLSETAGGAPQDWRFVASPSGKPQLDHRKGPDLRFSLSHRRGLVACAVSLGEEVGVDVEPLALVPDALALARTFFSKREADGLQAMTEPARSEAFAYLWTCKEAYCKATGVGLRDRLDRPEFDLARRPNSGASFRPISPEDWTLRQFPLPGPSILALAAPLGVEAPSPVQCQEADVKAGRLELGDHGRRLSCAAGHRGVA